MAKISGMKSGRILREFIRSKFWRWKKGYTYALIILAVSISKQFIFRGYR